MGAAGCGFGNECGGCDAGIITAVCSWGSVELPWEQAQEIAGDAEAACAAAQLQYQTTASQNGIGGNADKPDSNGGASDEAILPGICPTFVAAGDHVLDCDFGCAETSHERKAGTCTIGGECCVLVFSQSCGV